MGFVAPPLCKRPVTVTVTGGTPVRCSLVPEFAPTPLFVWIKGLEPILHFFGLGPSSTPKRRYQPS
jgi:hypothetical protein